VRRLLPWALLALIGVGAGLGAALGQVNAPGPTSSSVLVGGAAQSWLSGVLAATQASGTAHLDYTGLSTSPNPLLRGSSSGSGVVDFAAGTYRTSETDHSTEWSSQNGRPVQAHAQTTSESDIAIGSTLYENFGPGNLPSGWTKTPDHRDKSALGLGSANGLGFVLSGLTGPVTTVSVRELGPASVDGAPAARYLVRTELRPICPDPGRRVPEGSTTVWVDSNGRLVQARDSLTLSATFGSSLRKGNPELGDVPFGPLTFISTLRFSAFSAPVHIVAPKLQPNGSASSVSGEITATATTRCG
jgi:hypothetical protein